MPELLKLVTSNWADSMWKVFQKLLNEAMGLERAGALGAEPHGRTPCADRIRQRVQAEEHLGPNGRHIGGDPSSSEENIPSSEP